MSSPPNLFSVFLAVALALGVVSPAIAQPTRKLDRVLNEVVQTDRDSGKRHEVIVRARPGYGSWLRAQLLEDGVEIQSEHPSIDGMALALTATEINTLRGGGAVEHCSSNPVVTATAGLPKPGGPAAPGKPAADSKAADPRAPRKDFMSLSGISMAAGVTTGAVASLRQKAGMNLTPHQARRCSSSDDGKPYDRMTQGTGGLNAGGALRVGTAIDFSATDTQKTWTPSLPLCPSVQEGETAATLNCSTSIDGRLHVWARNIVWGDNIVG